MIRKFSYFSVLLLSLASCTITTSTDDDIKPDSSGISDQPAQGKFTSQTTAVVKTALYKAQTMFGENGYLISIYDTSADCKAGTPPVSFFITKLEKGTFKGKGPYFYYYKDANNFGTTSFMGCEVVITKVTATTLEGKVKGGNTATNQYIEGTFSASLCK